MNRAQGAIDAARAAGAEQYATTEYAAATTALQNANNAVAAGDYRLALNYALESHDHAQNAARNAADTKARTRAEVERAIPETHARIVRARARIATAVRAGVQRLLFAGPSGELDAAEQDLQKAGEAGSSGEYLKAMGAVATVREKVEKAMAAINAVRGSPPRRRR